LLFYLFRFERAANQIRPFCWPYPEIGQQSRAIFTIRDGFGSVIGAQYRAKGIAQNKTTRLGAGRLVGTKAGKLDDVAVASFSGISDSKQVENRLFSAA
jgi:hypothetical protein